jgi:hypothetical protein
VNVIGVLIPLSFIEIEFTVNVVVSSMDFAATDSDTKVFPWREETMREPALLTICAELRVRNCRVLIPVKCSAYKFEVFTESWATTKSELMEEGTVIGAVKRRPPVGPASY